MASEREEAAYWKAQMLARTRGELETVRKAAGTWSALFAAVLGVFGTVTFAGGLTGIDDLDASWQPWVKGATILAAVAVLVAVVYSGMASGTMPERTDDTTWEGLRDSEEAAAEGALGHLRVAKLAGAGAAVLVLLGSAAVLLLGPGAPESGPSVIAIIDGRAVCGELTAGSPMTIDQTPLTGVASVTIVDHCPP